MSIASGYGPDWTTEVGRMVELQRRVVELEQQLAVAQAELSADAKWQAVIDQIADDEDRMHEQIELWARQSYRRSRSGVRGTTITRADSEVTHYVWAALRWAHEREQAEARELRAGLARVRELAAKWRAAPQNPDEPLLAMAADELEAALSQPAERHDPLAVSDHCGECGEPEPECACDERIEDYRPAAQENKQ